jgi:hypothetical protein
MPKLSRGCSCRCRTASDACLARDIILHQRTSATAQNAHIEIECFGVASAIAIRTHCLATEDRISAED